MLNGSTLDNLIRSTLNEQVADESPSASVRTALLAEAARVSTRSSVGPAIPPLVRSLREADAPAAPPLTQWPAFFDHRVAEKWLMMVVPVYAVR